MTPNQSAVRTQAIVIRSRSWATRKAAVGLAVTLLLVSCSGQADDESTIVRDIDQFEVELACRSCEVRVSDPILLDTTRIPGFNKRSKISVHPINGDGLLAYGPTDTEGQFGVARLLGSAAPRIFGQLGDGPNEIQKIRTLAFAGADSIVLLHSATFTAYSLRDSTSARQPLPPGVSSFELVVSPSRNVLIGNHVPSRKRIAVQAIGGGGENEFMGASVAPGGSLLELGPTEYHLTLENDTTVIAIPKQDIWGISRWSLSGDSLDAGFIEAPTWFVPFTPASVDAAREAKDSAAMAAVTYVLDAEILQNRYLLLTGRVLDTRPVPATLDTLARWNYANDTVLDVYDLHTNRLVSRLRFDAVFTFLVPGGFLVRFLEDPDGFISVSLRRIQVEAQ